MSTGATLGRAVAGTWYPEDRRALASLVDRLVAEARVRQDRPEGPPAAVIVPHAGFAYSGAVAASAFARIAAARFDLVVLLGPSHYFDFGGAAIPREAAAYGTPLADSPIDRDAMALLARTGRFVEDDRLFGPEHSLEAELPFVQRTCDAATPVVPVLLGPGTVSDDTRAVAGALSEMLTPRTLVVVSSDFTHYGPRFGYTPFRDEVPERIRRLDLDAIGPIEEGDADGFARFVERTRATICGHRAIETMLRLPGPRPSARLVEYDSSGRMTGSFEHSVSYASLVAAADPAS